MLYFPAGNYLVSSANLVSIKSNTIYDGGGTIILNSSASSTLSDAITGDGYGWYDNGLFYIDISTSAENVIIKNLTIDVSRVIKATGIQIGGRLASYSSSQNKKNISILNTKIIGQNFDHNGDQYTITGSISSGVGIFCSNIDGLTIRDCEITKTGFCIVPLYCNDVVIDNNIMS